MLFEMRLIFCYVGEFRNIVRESFNFSPDYFCYFERGTLYIERRELSEGKRSLLDSGTKNLSVIVGKSGSGKTNLLELLGMPEDLRITNSKESKYFILYSVNPDENLFAIEINRILPKGISSGQRIDSPSLIYFKYSNGKIVGAKVRGFDRKLDTVIIHSFDLGATRKGYFDGLHIDGVFHDSFVNPRMLIPYDKVNAEVACWYAQRYVSEFSENNIKRDAALKIRSINWLDKMKNELKPELVESEYSFYHDFLSDKLFKNVRDVPRMTENLFGKIIHPDKGSGKSEPDKEKPKTFKEQFIHDLLTDFALYLRKWADTIKPIPESKMKILKLMGLIHDLGIKEFAELPDGKCPDLRRRIDWLCQYIDVHTDEVLGNRGLLWQIGTDILDIADAFEAFDDSFFEDGYFVYPLEDIDFEDSATEKLFERMGGYRADQLGVFSSELLPFEITYLSSGEYQMAKVLGILNEFSSTVKVRSQKEERPKSIILLLDEPETFMHPEMCRGFIYNLASLLFNTKEKDWDVQVIMTTHSPFMLSDLIPEQITRITFDDNGFCRVLPYDNRPTFASDIFSIMSRDFFLEYNIGELSRRRISAIVAEIKKTVDMEEGEEKRFRLEVFSGIVNEIGDPLIRETLDYMIHQAGKGGDVR